MSQRNPLNERYNDENRTGKTRKSSASAKPKAARAATVRDPAPKTKKQKKEEARERERKAAQKANVLEARFEETEGYKRLRRYWWIALGSAIACTAASFIMQNNAALQPFSMAAMILAYVLIIVAFWIDLGKIRKERKIYNAALVTNKSKEARREQKRIRAEHREQEKEAAEKYEAAKAEEAEKAARKGGFLARFRKDKPAVSEGQQASDGESHEAAKASTDKATG